MGGEESWDRGWRGRPELDHRGPACQVCEFGFAAARPPKALTLNRNAWKCGFLDFHVKED